MSLKIENIHPKFRQLVDLLFLSERTDLDLSNFKSLFGLNYVEHMKYMRSSFDRSSVIFWENGLLVWEYRLKALFSLNDTSLREYISKSIEKKAINLLSFKKNPHPLYDMEIVQFIAYCKVNAGHLSNVKSLVAELPAKVEIKKLIKFVEYTSPYLFKDLKEFAQIVITKGGHSSRQFALLQELDKYGVKFDKQPLADMVRLFIFNKNSSDYSYDAVFRLISDNDIRALVKTSYKPSYKNNLLKFLHQADDKIIEDKGFKNIINIIDIAPNIADDLAALYINQVYLRVVYHNKANADKIIALLKAVPQISNKKVLALLSSKNKINCIKYLLKEFPNLRKLAAFV